MLFTSQNVLVIISKEEISHNENRNCWNVPRQWLVVNVHSHDYFLPPRGLRQMQPLHFRSTFSSGENEIILRVHILNLDGMKTASDVHKLPIGEKKCLTFWVLSNQCKFIHNFISKNLFIISSFRIVKKYFQQNQKLSWLVDQTNYHSRM